MPDVFEKLAALTDTQAHKVLNRVISGLSELHPDLPVGDPKALAIILAQFAPSATSKLQPRSDSALSDQSASERQVLIFLAGTEQGAAIVGAAISHSRDVLVEPVTVALVMAGIIFALQLEFDGKITRKDGKTDFEVSLKKKPTDDSLIEKLLGLLS